MNRSNFTKKIKNFVFVIVLAISNFNFLYAQTETLAPGAFIINMGVVPQTVGNALKPYGLIYDLMKNNNVPIKWVVSQSKLKDGPDFTYKGVQYKGGTFIIPAEYRTAAVNAKIATAITAGVIGTTTDNTPLTVNVTKNLIAIPKWTLDDQNGSKAEAYLIAAGISNTLFPGAYNWKAPATLDCCDDFFVMPHADPIWPTHGRLFSWNKDCLGSIWAACHATSALENMVNPANRSQQTNFLTQKVAGLAGASGNYALSNSLILWGKHSGGSVPYVHQLPGDLNAQYMGPTDAAHQNGSEQINIPNQSATGGWNTTAKIIAYDPTQANVTNPLRPDKTNAAAVIVYDRGFGDPTRGYVMYEPAHTHAGTAPDNIAAQRVFLNFSFFQVQPKAPQLTTSGVLSGQQITGGNTITGLSVSATSPLAGITFTYAWSSSCGGTFSNATGATTNFTAPTVGAVTNCVITCLVTDNCGRKSFQSIPVTILPPPAPPTVVPDVASLPGSCKPGTTVTLNVLTNDVPNGSTITFTSLNQGAASPLNAGTWTTDGMGNVTFEPAANFNGAATITYTVTNTQGLTNTATITVNVGSTDVNGCTSNQVYSPTDVGLITMANFVSQVGTTAVGITDVTLDDAENLYSISNNTTTTGNYIDLDNDNVDNLVLSIGSTLPLRAKDTININWSKSSNNVATMSVQIGTSGTGPWTNTQVFTNSISASGTAGAAIATYTLPTGATGITHMRISSGSLIAPAGSSSNVYVDAIEYLYLSCVSKAPQLTNDAITVLEDAKFDVRVLDNDNDPQDLPLTITRIVTQPTNGKVSINLDGTITFYSTKDVATATSFVYEACNTQGYCSTATVSLTIAADGCAVGSFRANPPAGAATKVFQFGFTGTNAATTNATATNFRDSKLNQASGGNDNYGADTKIEVGKIFGSTQALRDIFQFNITDIPAGAIIQSATFSANRQGGNNDIQTVNLHGLTTGFVENQVTWLLSSTGNNWSPAGGAFGGVVSSASLGSLKTYYNWDVKSLVESWYTTPANNFGLLLKTGETLNKSHTLYTKEAALAFRPKLTVTYVVPVACAPILNRAPLANPDAATTMNGESVVITPLPNDGDIDAGDTYTITDVFGITAGSATFTGTTITYTANTTAIVPRTERLTYVITDNNGAKDSAYVYITVTNAPPKANPNTVTTTSGALINIPVVVNDVDPEGGLLTPPVITVAPKNGLATVVGNTIDYTPNAGFTGRDSLIYQLCEASADPCSPVTFCDTAIVFITVTNQPPVAVNDSRNVPPCLSTTIKLIANDTDPEGGKLAINSLSILSNPAAGTLVNNLDGSVTFTPAVGFSGPVTFDYTIIDDGVTPAVSTPPTTITLTVAAVTNLAPIAVNDADEINMNEVSYYSVKDNDSEPNGDFLKSPTIFTPPTNGTAIVLENGLIQYTPNLGFFGTDVLTYQLCDSSFAPAGCTAQTPLCATATVTYTILLPNSVKAINDENSTFINTPVTGGVMGNDYDIEGNAKIFTGFIDALGNPITTGTITVSGVDATGAPVANAGTLAINPDGTYTFTPANNFAGVVTVPYGIMDDNAIPANDLALLRITVNPLPSLTNSVIANNDENTSTGGAVAGNVVANDRDPQGNPFVVTGFTYDNDGDTSTPAVAGVVGGAAFPIGGQSLTGVPTPNAGSLTLNADGSYTFVPTPGFTGSVDVPYTICDNVVPPACQTAILHIDVLPDLNGPANNPPVPGDDFNFTDVNTPVNGSFAANDSDPNANPISIGGVTIVPGGPATPVGAPVPTAKGGSIQYFANGTYLYTPPAGYVGPDSATYQICDVTVTAPQPLCANAIIHLLVGVKNSTDAINDETSTWQDVNVSGGVMSNDFDAENNTQTFGAFLTQGATPGAPLAPATPIAVGGVDKSGAPIGTAGTITFATDGTYTFDPSPTFVGTVSIPYSLCDNGNLNKCDTAYLTITIDSLPSTSNNVIANNDENVSYGAPVTNTLFANDRDPQGNTFTVTSFTGGTVGTSAPVAGTDANGNPVANAGTLVINADGTYTFTPNAGFTGSINVPYTITDALGATSIASLHIDVLKDPNGPANDAPFAGDDFGYTTVNKPVNGNFISNDSDPNANPVSVGGITIVPGGPATPIDTVATAQGGTVVYFANGTYLYTPPAGYVGPDNVNYTICDVTAVAPQPLCNTAALHLLVGIGNTTEAINDETSTWQDVNVSGGVMSNDFDAENHPQIFGAFLTQGATPGAPLTPATPIAVGGVSKAGAPIGTAGTITFAPDGTYTFDPDPAFVGTVSIPYSVCDNGNLSKCDTAYLTITVDPFPSTSNNVIANNDENVSYGGATVNGDLDGNDRDPQGNAFTVTSFTGGTVGTPLLTVPGIDANGNPVADAGDLTINADGTYTFVPAPGFTGSVTVPYTITDALGATSTATLKIDVLRDPNGPANDAPFAGDDFGYTTVNKPVNGNFISNDSDPNANPVSVGGITIVPGGPATPIDTVATAQGGTVVYFANGTYLYTPPAGYVGPDNVNYTICDVTAVAPQPLCNTATLHLLVGVDNSTDAINDETSTWQDVNVSGGVMTNDFDAENNTQTFGAFLTQGATPGAPLTPATPIAIGGVSKAGAPVGTAGTITFATDGTYTFDPDPAFVGTVSIPYSLCDNGNLNKCDTAYLTITVDSLPTSGANTVIANNDENVSYGAPVTNTLFANDRDPQGNTFTVTSFTGGTVGTSAPVAGTDANGNPVANAGTLVINADGTYTFTPNAGFTGSINVPYTITDALGATSIASLHIDVLKDPNGPANDAPFAGDDFGYTTVNTPVNGNFISNDSDPNANPVSVGGITIVPGGPATPIDTVATAQGGTVVYFANGTYLYTPPAGYVGPDNVNYTICDVTAVAPQPLCNTATLHLLVGPGITIGGKVWNDANGNVIDAGASEPETNVSGVLYVNLLDAGGNVVATTPVANDGSYSFTNVAPNASYSVQLTTNIGTPGAAAPATALPVGWVNTGETRNGVIDLGSAGVIDTRAFGFTNAVNLDFGIERLPESNNVTQTIALPMGNSIPAGAVTLAVAGTDGEDGTLGSGNNINITTLPTNATLVYNGVPVTLGQSIVGFDPALISYTGITAGSMNIVFGYAFVDAAGKADPTPATYTVNWLGALPVKFISFTAVKTSSKTSKLNFSVAQSYLGSVYYIERSFTNSNFVSIGSIVATLDRTYTFDDNSAIMNATNFYRIKEVDQQGVVTYSIVRSLKFEGKEVINVFPKPAIAIVNISMNETIIGRRINIKLYDAYGNVVLVKNIRNTAAIEQINVAGLVNGTYNLQVINVTDSKIVGNDKFIVAH